MLNQIGPQQSDRPPVRRRSTGSSWKPCTSTTGTGKRSRHMWGRAQSSKPEATRRSDPPCPQQPRPRPRPCSIGGEHKGHQGSRALLRAPTRLVTVARVSSLPSQVLLQGHQVRHRRVRAGPEAETEEQAEPGWVHATHPPPSRHMDWTEFPRILSPRAAAGLVCGSFSCHAVAENSRTSRNGNVSRRN